MTKFIFILAYFIVIGYIIWYFTCTTDKKDIPLLLEIVTSIISLIPGIHVIAVLIIPVIIWYLNYEGDLSYKNNWFNRIFLK